MSRATKRRAGPKGARPILELVVLQGGLADDELPPRPRTRGDCEGGLRPCPWVGCRYNLWMELRSSGSIAPSFPGVEPEDMEHSCALDSADEGGLTLDEVGARLGVSRERIRQVEVSALRKVHHQPDFMRALADLHEASDDRVHALEEIW